MDIQELAERLQRLEELEAIKKLKYEYALRCDRAVNDEDPAPFVEIFTEDGVWDIGAFGAHRGKATIRQAVCRALADQVKFTYHFFTNPMIDIDGDVARGKWYLWAIYTMADGRDMVLAGYEDEAYRKVVWTVVDRIGQARGRLLRSAARRLGRASDSRRRMMPSSVLEPKLLCYVRATSASGYYASRRITCQSRITFRCWQCSRTSTTAPTEAR